MQLFRLGSFRSLHRPNCAARPSYGSNVASRCRQRRSVLRARCLPEDKVAGSATINGVHREDPVSDGAPDQQAPELQQPNPVTAAETSQGVNGSAVAAPAAAAAAATASVGSSTTTEMASSSSSSTPETGPEAAACGPGQPSTQSPHPAALSNEFGDELKRVVSLAIPISIQNLAGFSLSIVGAVFIGRLGPLPLSASVLANSLYNCSGLSIAMGLSAGMETLCGQSNGAGNYPRVGIILQRGLLVCWSLCVGVALLWLASHSILIALGQQPEISALASRYLILCIPCLFLSISMECIKKYLQAQRAVLPAMGAAAVATLLSPLIFWWFVVKAGLGLDGAAYAFICCQVMTLVGLLGYTMYRARVMEGHPQQTWGGWSPEAFKGWGEYLNYGLPAAAMICMEWWAYEAVILMAGLLPQAEIALSTMGVCLNINAWGYMLPMGLASAVNTSISNALGAGDAKAAKNIFLGGILSACCLQAAIVLGVLTVGPQVVKLFCSDPTVIASCVSVLPLLSVLMFFDGINSVASGVLRGAGRQALGAGINALGYWVVGVPLAAALAFAAGLGIQGFWLGVGSGALLQAVVVMVLVSRWDWEVEVERVRAAVAASAGKAVLSYGH